MFPPRPTELLHLLLREVIRDGDLVVDATAGNGHDTVFLADCVGPTGKVLALDIQQQAIDSTRARLQESGLLGRASLHCVSHASLADLTAEATASVIIFNLGYLPGADHGTITQTAATLEALRASCQVLKPGGALAVVCYPGHPGGDQEAAAVEAFFQNLEKHRTARYSMLATKKPAPFLLLSQRIC